MALKTVKDSDLATIRELQKTEADLRHQLNECQMQSHKDLSKLNGHISSVRAELQQIKLVVDQQKEEIALSQRLLTQEQEAHVKTKQSLTQAQDKVA